MTADTSPDGLYQRECSREWTGCKKQTDILGGKHTDNDIPTQSHHCLRKRTKTSYKTKVESVSDAVRLAYFKQSSAQLKGAIFSAAFCTVNLSILKQGIKEKKSVLGPRCEIRSHLMDA